MAARKAAFFSFSMVYLVGLLDVAHLKVEAAGGGQQGGLFFFFIGLPCRPS
jgi:hypothetical protein